MSETVQITVYSIITDAVGEVDELTLYTEANYRHDSKKAYLMYEETEISGMENTRTLLIYDGEQVQIKRFGKTESLLSIRLGEIVENHYHTPYGMFHMSTMGRLIHWQLGDQLTIELAYSLDIQGERSEVRIKIDSKKVENVEKCASEKGN